jgi:hypothetical protein
MGWAIRGASSGGVALSASPQTVTLPVTTLAGDIIVLSIGNNNATITYTGSGAGATWVTEGNVQNDRGGYVVGYNCSAGQTSMTLTSSGGPAGHFCVAVISGGLASASPVRSFGQGSGSANGVADTLSSGSGVITYAAGDLIVGLGVSFVAFASGNASWSNGATDHFIDAYFAGGTQAPWMSYSTPVTGTTTNYTTPVPTGTQGAYANALVLKPAPPVATGNMLLVA